MIYKLVVGEYAENCYIIETENKNAVIIDPGAESGKILDFLEKKGLEAKVILLTHGHHDHIGAVADIVEKTKVKVFIHQDDAPMLTCDELKDMGIKMVCDAVLLKNGDVITQDELDFKLLHTAGHTLGSSFYTCGDVIFTGDTLFRNSIGRTDFLCSDSKKMKETLKMIKEINGEFALYCGHGSDSTLDYEKKFNPFLTRI